MGETAQEVASTSVFSLEERERMVRSFIGAFLRGTVKITLFTDDAVISKRVVHMDTGKKIELHELGDLKTSFLRSIDVICGVGNYSREIVKQHIDSIFGGLVAFRGGGFIEGEFLDDPQLAVRLSKLEERVGSMEKLLEDLQQIWRIRGPP